jgi:hypothetical protein
MTPLRHWTRLRHLAVGLLFSPIRSSLWRSTTGRRSAPRLLKNEAPAYDFWVGMPASQGTPVWHSPQAEPTRPKWLSTYSRLVVPR